MKQTAASELPAKHKTASHPSGWLVFFIFEFLRLGIQFLPVCLSILRHGFRRATSFSKEANKAITCCIGSFGKGAARRAED